MSDFLLELGQNPSARRLIKSLGLPLPMPEKLRRATGPWEERPLFDRDVGFGASAGANLVEACAESLVRAGANPHVVGSPELLASFIEPGEAYGRPPVALEVDLADPREGTRLDALVFDASGIRTPAQLRALYDFLHPLVGGLAKSGRVVIVARPADPKDPVAAASVEALTGFVRSLAKEIGKKGATAQLICVTRGAEDRFDAVLRFVLSSRSAFLSGQPLTVTAQVEAGPAPFTHSLDGKVALVTGAARGIGEATARLLAAEGAHVVCLDRPADDGPLSQVARSINGSVLLCDVTDPDAPEIIARHLADAHGGVDIVVHNAGVTRDKTLARMKPEQWDQTVDINLGAVTRITDRLLSGPLRGGGRIICLSSIAGIAGNLGQTNYAASKSGLIGYVRALAPTVAGRGITVNAVAPGFIETRLTEAIPVMIREVGRRLSALGQGGQPQDIGEVITFLASPGAAGLTGSTIRVCGGAFVGA
ncbi:MAG TPA: 3-oxoacyl-ACP reductase [Kofleriaceae bacterium]|nr:3-oxoacyl-ACP reductase [Kofleriaceae bacterium]